MADGLRGMSKRFVVALSVTWSLCVAEAQSVDCEHSTRGRAQVLILNSYSPQYRWADVLARSERKVLSGVLTPEQIDEYHMGARPRLDDPEFRRAQQKLLEIRLRSSPRPTLIIANDDYAVDLALEANRNGIIQGIPVVHTGVNLAHQWPACFTGVIEGDSILATLKMIWKIQPQLERVVFLTDTTSTGAGLEQVARGILANTPNIAPKAEFWNNESHESLLEKVARLTPRDAVLMLALHRDRDGRYFSYVEDLPDVSNRSGAPVYGMWGDLILGHGGIGGVINNPTQQGQMAARMALDIIDGKPVSKVPTVNARYEALVDFNQMSRFGLEETALPAGVRVVNAPPNLYESYKFTIWTAALLAASLMVLQLAMLFKRRAQNKLLQLAKYDAMTGALSALGFGGQLVHEVARTERPAREMVVMRFQLSNWRLLRDREGNDDAQRALMCCYSTARTLAGPQALVGRIELDELAVALAIRDESALTLLQKFQAALQAKLIEQKFAIPLAVEAGASIAPADGTDPIRLLHAADLALEYARRSRQSVALYDEQTRAFWQRKLDLEQKLNRALERDEIELFLQPKIDAKSMRVVGVEGLARWRSDEGGLRNAAEFVSEDTSPSLMMLLNDRVCAAAVALLDQWQSDAALNQLSIAINIGAFEDYQYRLLTWTRTLPRTVSERLTYEITESNLLRDTQTSINQIASLRETGVSISIDDFGTGWSNIGQFSHIAVSELKIDRRFVADAALSERGRRLLAAMIEVGRSLNLHIVLEGVESEQEAQTVKSMNADIMQGYHFARPMPASEFAGWLAKWDELNSIRQ